MVLSWIWVLIFFGWYGWLLNKNVIFWLGIMLWFIWKWCIFWGLGNVGIGMSLVGSGIVVDCWL